MAEPFRLAAVDLGATSGRVMLGEVTSDRLTMHEVHRFPNDPVPVPSQTASGTVTSLHWDLLRIHAEVLAGLRAATGRAGLDGIGIDSWAIDYGLLDRTGALLGNPYCYRDTRTDGVAAQVLNKVDAAEMYSATGLQQLPFTTLYQLVAARDTPQLAAADTLLLLPDLLAHWLTGAIGAERTNASTTGLYDVRSGTWAYRLAERVGVPSSLLPPLRDPGDDLGALLPDIAAHVGVEVPVLAVGSHDTASAVVGTPLGDRTSVYISSGTWSLVGMELDAPVLTEDARLADFTNETGVDGTIRFLKNVMGLWVLSECLRDWEREGNGGTSLPALLSAAGEAEPLRTVVDINACELLTPSTGSARGSMAQRIAGLARAAGEPVPATRVQVVRCILDSLAIAYRRHVHQAAALACRSVRDVHVVGGGAKNALLCQLTADACQVPVLAGPSEAAALGNALVQARTLGADLPDLASMRDLIRRTHNLDRYQPRDDMDWAAAERRLPDVPKREKA